MLRKTVRFWFVVGPLVLAVAIAAGAAQADKGGNGGGNKGGNSGGSTTTTSSSTTTDSSTTTSTSTTQQTNKGSGGGSSSTTTSSIAIASVNGTSLLGAASPLVAPTFGASMTFATTVQPLAGWQYAMVALTCYQDVNGDGYVNTSISGPDIVYSSLETPSTTFSVGSDTSIWGELGGGAATCRADLDAYGWKKGVESVVVLATTGDWAVSG